MLTPLSEGRRIRTRKTKGKEERTGRGTRQIIRKREIKGKRCIHFFMSNEIFVKRKSKS